MSASFTLLIAALCLFSSACQHLADFPTDLSFFSPDTAQHLHQKNLPADADSSTPPSAPIAPLLPSLASPRPSLMTYSLSVSRVNVQDFLFALARDGKLNVDIHPDIQGTISLNAVNQTLPQILERLSKQVDLRYEFADGVLRILPDTPYLVHYPVDYVNISRQVTTTVSANTQISSGPSADVRSLAQSNSPSGNISNTRVENVTGHHFWTSLERNIQDILRETDKLLPEGNTETLTETNHQRSSFGVKTGNSSGTNATPSNKTNNTPSVQNNTILSQPLPPANPQAESNNAQNHDTKLVRTRTFREAASVIVNPEGGLVSVRATARQHASVSDFLQRVLKTAHRQVLIEATVVEVELTDGYQQGIDWSRLGDSQQFSITRADVGGNPTSGLIPFALSSKDQRNPINTSFAIDLLRSFGKVKVLSSPRLAVMNNQTALLKVVENVVYFSVKADTLVTANVGQTTTVTTTPQSVSVGLVMSVTPQISEAQQIILNVRPTISSIAKFVSDPNPVIPIPNQVPQIRTREIESVLSLQTGEVGLLGGLMEDRLEQRTGLMPGLSAIPWLGELFTTRNNGNRKAELVIFLRPVRVDTPQATLARLHKTLPDEAFFHAR